MQSLSLLQGDEVLRGYSVSTAKNGAGCKEDSGCTPTGEHLIAAKIGGGLASGSALGGRRATGEVWTQKLHQANPARDWILSRILWLEGCEKGVNRGAGVDTMRRYIYIHGTPDSEPMGTPLSHGCVRMRNADVIELFDLVGPGTPVSIQN